VEPRVDLGPITSMEVAIRQLEAQILSLLGLVLAGYTKHRKRSPASAGGGGVVVETVVRNESEDGLVGISQLGPLPSVLEKLGHALPERRKVRGGGRRRRQLD